MKKWLISIIAIIIIGFSLIWIIRDYLDNRIDRVLRDSFELHDNGYPNTAEDRSSITKIYSASDITVQQAVELLGNQVKPLHIGSMTTDRAIMVYPEDLVLIMRDPAISELIWIELSNRKFVTEVMDPELLERYEVFDSVSERWGLPEMNGGNYEGYIDRSGKHARIIVPYQQVWFESAGFVPQRGGGTSAGK